MIKSTITAITTSVLLICATAVSAQVVSISGKVTMKQADGSEMPVQGAIVDIYRTDISQTFQLKTDRKGVYTHGGLAASGTYTLAVSAPGAKPEFASHVRFNVAQEKNFVLSPGDGKRLTLEEIKAISNPNPNTSVVTAKQFPTSDKKPFEYRGINVGMLWNAVLKKLGKPHKVGETLLGGASITYSFGEEKATIWFDKSEKVLSIDVSYPETNFPSVKDVLGENYQPDEYGFLLKRVNYPKAGVYVQYYSESKNGKVKNVTVQMRTYSPPQ